jgi:hypothetical protein
MLLSPLIPRTQPEISIRAIRVIRGSFSPGDALISGCHF